MPLLAALHVPDFLQSERLELHVLYNILRDHMATHVFGLLLIHADFETGEFLGGYDRLMDLCTPPQPERGKRRPGPSRWTIRRVIDDLVKHQIVRRDAAKNAAQGQLRLWVNPRKKDATPKAKDHRVSRRLQKSEKLASTRLPASPMDESPQVIPQGYQVFNSTSPTPSKTASYPPSAEGKKGKAAALALLDALKSSPPNAGGRKGPRIDPDSVPY